jgi:hypothetical protein
VASDRDEQYGKSAALSADWLFHLQAMQSASLSQSAAQREAVSVFVIESTGPVNTLSVSDVATPVQIDVVIVVVVVIEVVVVLGPLQPALEP